MNNIKIFIKLFSKDMFRHLKEIPDVLIAGFEELFSAVTSIFAFILTISYSILLTAVLPLRIIQIIYYAFKYRKQWMM